MCELLFGVFFPQVHQTTGNGGGAGEHYLPQLVHASLEAIQWGCLTMRKESHFSANA